jgi:signal transduction histidine kinase
MTASRIPLPRSWRDRAGPTITEALPPGEESVQGWLVRHPIPLDVAIAVAVAVFAVLVDTLGSDYRSHGAGGWDVLVAAPLMFRRRHPTPVAILVGAICLAQWLAGVRATGDVAVLVVLYSLGAHERRRMFLAVAVVTAELGVIMAVTRWSAPSNEVLAIATATGTVTASWVAGIYISMRGAYVTSIRERAETAERERDSRAQVAVAAERARLAREMHDVIAHSLSVMITLNDAASAVEMSPQAHDTITQASEVGRQALDEMHRMLAVLRTGEPVDYAPQPGLAQLAELVSVVRTAGLTVELAVTGDMAGIAPTAELAVYRIVQESLTNILKHARNVEQVRVEVVRRRERIELCIGDDGSSGRTGVTTGRPPMAQPGHGLSGMRERARLFGGEVQVGPGPTGGWEVRAWLHLARPPGRA